MFFDNGSLDRYAQKGFIAIAVSQPGYGNYDGPADFCGPLSQAAVRSIMSIFKERTDVNSHEIFLYGISRGALVASMIATQDCSLGGVILDSEFYNLRTVIDQKTLSNIAKETQGMIENIDKEANLTEESMHLRSSVDYISQIKCPVLMFHGFNDNRAPVKQAIDFYENLSKAGTSAQLHLSPCGHHTPCEEKKALVDLFLEKKLSLH